MGTSKTEQFTVYQNEFAEIAKALAHPARIAILQHLMKINQCVCGSLVNEIGLAQSTTSQHLKILKDAQLIKGEIDGKNVCYCINQPKWEEFSLVFTSFFNQGMNQENCCEQ